jgi:hypothetical protein
LIRKTVVSVIENNMTAEEKPAWAEDVDHPFCGEGRSAHSVLAGLRQQGILAELARAEKADSESERTMEIPAFNPLKDVSADAKHITRTLWTIFVLLPVIFGILFAVLMAAAILTATGTLPLGLSRI